MSCPLLERRRFAAALSMSFASLTLPAAVRAQGSASRPSRTVPVLLQCFDTSADQQEISRDYASGVQLGLQGASPGTPGRVAAALRPLPMDGSDASLQRLLTMLRGDPSIVGLVGAAGERLALRCIEATRAAGLAVAHLGPWIADARFDDEPGVVKLFASREAQIRHALRSLETVGVRELGLVYASPQLQQQVRTDVQAALARIGVQPREFVAPAGQLEALVASLPDNPPAIFLFVGGAVELARFVRGLAVRRMQRYVVTLGETDLTTLAELGASGTVPVVLTQVVPNPQTHTAPFAREYRAALKALYEEQPSPLSLAGFIAGRYAQALLATLEPGALNRAGVLDAARRRPGLELGGYSIRFDAGTPRGSGYVTQVLLGRDGRLIG
ncbi:MAG: ABC transporter substrate-binding protein [Caldimonas sp.]|uniref:ABC transporter substrate-binding protein n=1 Tax=Caldimonas sp. TaxID=2838790 RepID=UPI00391D172C